MPPWCATSGVDRIIADYDPSTDSGYGFLFYEYGSEPLWDAIKRARQLFENRGEWERLCERAAKLNFSWALAAERYEDLYEGLVPRAAAA